MFEDIVWLLDNSLFYGVKEKLRRCCEKKLTPTVVLTAGVLFVGEGGQFFRKISAPEKRRFLS